MSLVISEIFYSIQGEGISTGAPSVFVRLAGCNLLCKSENWVCDSIEVWKKGTKFNHADVLPDEYVSSLAQGAHLIFTGGEPMLQQRDIVEYFEWFQEKFKFLPFVEIETNGTVVPNIELQKLVNQWNVSPKLDSSGALLKFNMVALKVFSKLNTQFKFVISTKNDIEEILSVYMPLVRKSKVVLMPAGDSQESLLKTRLYTIELCKIHGFYYSDRLHIVVWNLKTGV